MLSQNETLADNSKHLAEYEILKLDHQDEIWRHQDVARRLNRSEETVEGLKARMKVPAELATCSHVDQIGSLLMACVIR